MRFADTSALAILKGDQTDETHTRYKIRTATVRKLGKKC